MLNVYEQVDRNKTKSVLVMVFFFLFIVLVGYLVSRTLEWGAGGIILSLLIASGSTLISYYGGDKIALNLSQARPVNRFQAPFIYSAVENLSRAAQIPPPKIYLSPDQSMNAFATGRNPQNASLCLTTGLVNNLNQTEIEGVIGHEISHIKNLDTRLFAIVSTLIGAVVILSRLVQQPRSTNRNQDQRSGDILFLFGIIAIILSPIIGQLIQLAISRRREFLADAGSAMLTRQPEGLINALEKLSQNTRSSKFANNATAHFFIVNPFLSQGKITGLANLFNTHPPIESRVAELKKMI